MDFKPTPELIQALADAGLLDDYLGLAKGQVAAGQDQAHTPMPTGQMIGDQFIAPHPLQFVSAILQRGRGEQKAAGAQAEMARLLRQHSNTTRDFYSQSMAFQEAQAKAQADAQAKAQAQAESERALAEQWQQNGLPPMPIDKMFPGPKPAPKPTAPRAAPMPNYLSPNQPAYSPEPFKMPWE